MALNKVILIGNLTKDVEVKQVGEAGEFHAGGESAIQEQECEPAGGGLHPHRGMAA